jgi:uncharacterized protein (TIGR02301 family)
MKMRHTLKIMAALTVWISPGLPAFAQTADPPYQAKLEVHFLRNLCGAATPVWREKMDALLTAEKAETERRARLVAHFNRGYRAFSSTYVKCTPSANLALSNYVKEGEGLTKEVVLRYGN